jgi:AraC-like DNA-binding protein/ligand-binding sensor protein
LMEHDKSRLEHPWLQDPLIQALGDIAAEAVGVQLLLIHPTSTGWSQKLLTAPGKSRPAFCRLIQSTEKGAQHCRMCHTLMTVAACSGGPSEQICHTGASVVVVPAEENASEAVAVLSSCLFASESSWETVRAQGERLNLDLNALREAYMSLPRLTEAQFGTLRAIMKAVNVAVKRLQWAYELEKEVKELRKGTPPAFSIGDIFKSYQPEVLSGSGLSSTTPMLIQVVCRVIRQRPELPLTVKEIASAARLTPNHFTSMFHRHTGKVFTDYLAQARIDKAKTLLKDLTLSIGEVARKVGYDDPGYFARRFCEKTGRSPRAWREQGDATVPEKTSRRPRPGSRLPKS